MIVFQCEVLKKRDIILTETKKGVHTLPPSVTKPFSYKNGLDWISGYPLQIHILLV